MLKQIITAMNSLPEGMTLANAQEKWDNATLPEVIEVLGNSDIVVKQIGDWQMWVLKAEGYGFLVTNGNWGNVKFSINFGSGLLSRTFGIACWCCSPWLATDRVVKDENNSITNKKELCFEFTKEMFKVLEELGNPLLVLTESDYKGRAVVLPQDKVIDSNEFSFYGTRLLSDDCPIKIDRTEPQLMKGLE